MSGEQTFRRIIVGCDGESSGRDALALGRQLAQLERADLIAAGVYTDPMLPFPRHSGLHEACARVLRADRDALAPEARLQTLPGGSPSKVLRHAVEYERADLLVLGSEQRAEEGRVRAGRHARQLLHGAPCAVALAPRGYAARDAELRRILVGFDATPEAADALAHGREIAAAAGGRVRALAAVDPMPPTGTGGFEAMVYLPSDWEQIADVRRRAARAQLEDAVGDAVGVDGEVVDGEPAVALCDASRDADLLVIGSRHWGPLSRLALGGTAEYVVRHASCPVLLVPRRATEAPPPAPQEHEQRVGAPPR